MLPINSIFAEPKINLPDDPKPLPSRGFHEWRVGVLFLSRRSNNDRQAFALPITRG